MMKQLVHSGRGWLGRSADPGLLSGVIVAVLGLALLIAEGAVLSPSLAVPLIAVLLASTASSIAGFAFSALCGAVLFHVMVSPVYTVQVMIVCSIAIQVFSVAALWRSIDWRSLPVFLMGGVLGVPAGVYLLLHLQTSVYHDVIGSLLIAYGGYLLLRRPTRSLRTGRLADTCAGFLGGLTGGLAGFPGAFVTIWCGLKVGQGTPTRCVSAVHSRHAADHAACHLSDAAVVLDRDATGLEDARFHSRCSGRRVVGTAHLQAAFRSAI
jgi:hypothetical protein